MNEFIVLDRLTASEKTTVFLPLRNPFYFEWSIESERSTIETISFLKEIYRFFLVKSSRL